MNKIWVAIVIVTAIMSGACTHTPTLTTPTPASASVNLPTVLLREPASDLLAFYDIVRKQPVAELNKEHDKAKQQLMQNKTDYYRMRLALLLTLPNTPFHDNAVAINLLNEVLKDAKTNTSSLHGLASLLVNELIEKQRIVDDLTQKFKVEQKRGDELKVKVDAIKNMEKSMARRDKHQ